MGILTLGNDSKNNSIASNDFENQNQEIPVVMLKAAAAGPHAARGGHRLARGDNA